MITIPPKGHDARRYLPDVAALADILDPKNAGRLPYSSTVFNTICITLDNDPAIVAVTAICIGSVTNERLLVRLGRSGEYDVLWNFSTGAAQ